MKKTCFLYFGEDKKTDKTDQWVDVYMPVSVKHHHYVIVQYANHAKRKCKYCGISHGLVTSIFLFIYRYNGRVSSWSCHVKLNQECSILIRQAEAFELNPNHFVNSSEFNIYNFILCDFDDIHIYMSLNEC